MAERRHAGALLLACLLLVGCAGEPAPLRVAVGPWAPFELLHWAAHRGHLPADAVELVTYASPAAAARDLRAGRVDVLATTLQFAVMDAGSSSGAGLRVFWLVDESLGGDSVLVRRGRGTLRGARLGYEVNPVSAWVLLRALEQAGLGLDAVEIVPLDPSRQVAAWGRGAVDALVTYDPVRTTLLGAGADEVFDSGDIPGEVYDVLLAQGDVLARHQAALAVLATGLDAAIGDLRTDPAPVLAWMAPRLGMDPQALGRVLGEDVALLRADDNRRLLGGTPAPLEDLVQRIHAGYRNAGYLDGGTGPVDLLDGRVVRSLPRAEPEGLAR